MLVHRWLLLFRRKGATGEKKKKEREDKPSSSVHLSFLANWWALGSRGVLCSQNDDGQKSAQKLQLNHRSVYINGVGNDVIFFPLTKLGRELISYYS